MDNEAQIWLSLKKKRWRKTQ